MSLRQGVWSFGAIPVTFDKLTQGHAFDSDSVRPHGRAINRAFILGHPGTDNANLEVGRKDQQTAGPTPAWPGCAHSQNLCGPLSGTFSAGQGLQR